MEPPLIENVQTCLLWDVRPVTVTAMRGLLVWEARGLESKSSTILSFMLLAGAWHEAS